MLAPICGGDKYDNLISRAVAH